MNWLYLFIAGLFEIGWPLSMKFSQSMHSKALGLSIAIVSMSLSCFFLWLAQKTIPIGTAYAIWTGIGAVGTVTLGIIFFGDSTNMWRLVSAFLIVVGIVGLRITN